MLRSVSLILIAVGLSVALLVLARRLFLKDVYGVRTAVAKRFAVNYEEKDLTSQDFSRAFLPYVNLRRTKLLKTNFSDANLLFADLTGADLEMARLSDTNLSHAVFQEAKLQQALFLDSTTLRHASFRNTNVSSVSFHGLWGRHRRSKRKHLLDPGTGGADMTGAVFDGALCQNTSFRRCVLTGASFRNSDCREADFEDADLRNADFTNADLRGAKLERADLTGAIFANAKRK